MVKYGFIYALCKYARDLNANFEAALKQIEALFNKYEGQTQIIGTFRNLYNS